MWEAGDRIQPGDYKYMDVTGDGKIDNNDRLPIGYTTIPEITYGFTAGLRYKNFDMTALIQGAAHVNYSTYSEQFGNIGYGDICDVSYECWNMEKYLSGDNIQYPRVSNVTANRHSIPFFWFVTRHVSNDALIENAAYIRLKNLELGYTFEKGILNKLRMESLRPYFSAQNLLTFSPMAFWDPEVGTASGFRGKYPVVKVFSFGVRASF
jgi:hypothetical protein